MAGAMNVFVAVAVRVAWYSCSILICAFIDFGFPVAWVRLKEICQMFTSTALQDLPPTARKVMAAFGPEIQSCINNEGQLSALLFGPFRLLRQRWRCDSQEIEGIMSMLKTARERANRMTLQTLDALVGNRKSLGYEAVG